jgi:hypothetical protein
MLIGPEKEWSGRTERKASVVEDIKECGGLAMEITMIRTSARKKKRRRMGGVCMEWMRFGGWEGEDLRGKERNAQRERAARATCLAAPSPPRREATMPQGG